MNKSILVIDTPQRCGGCPMFRFQFDDCMIDGRDVTEEIQNRTRRKDCPLRSLPDDIGWNEYLKKYWGVER